MILNQDTVAKLMMTSYRRGYNVAKSEQIQLIAKAEPDMLAFSKFLMEFDKQDKQDKQVDESKIKKEEKK
jgi:hypothetical protein